MSTSPTEAVFQAVQALTRSGRPTTTAAVCQRLGRAPSHVSALLHHLARTGWLEKRTTTRPQGGSGQLQWALTKKGRSTPYEPGLKYLDTPQRILDVMGEDEGLTIGELADRLGRPYETVRQGCNTLVRRRVLTKSDDGYRTVYYRPLPDDGWQPTTTYMSASRMYALGLKR